MNIVLIIINITCWFIARILKWGLKYIIYWFSSYCFNKSSFWLVLLFKTTILCFGDTLKGIDEFNNEGYVRSAVVMTSQCVIPSINKWGNCFNWMLDCYRTGVGNCSAANISGTIRIINCDIDDTVSLSVNYRMD